MSQEMAEFVLQVSDDRSANYVLTASIGQSRAWFWYTLNEISAALFIYDSLLTLSREVEQIWKPRPFFRLGTILYLLTRYPPLLFWAMVLYLELGNTSITADYKWITLVDGFGSTSALALDTIQATIVVGYETIILLITIWYMLSTVRRQRSLPDQFEKKSILFLIVYQARHSFVLTVSVTTAVTSKTLRLSLGSVIAPMQNFLSAIILCRFQLDLRERHVRRDDCTLDRVTLGTFKAATRRVHEAVMDEFGDTELIDSLQM
ncbi:hypothetical protein BU17DRAFT_63601 [Hysterangium stoloniferum]|nr:hypothetical protein BU17DRAFT_63601 [Hysterangium stoloniferum]